MKRQKRRRKRTRSASRRAGSYLQQVEAIGEAMSKVVEHISAAANSRNAAPLRLIGHMKSLRDLRQQVEELRYPRGMGQVHSEFRMQMITQGKTAEAEAMRLLVAGGWKGALQERVTNA